jgi:HK97 family phage prohead protease
MATTTIIKEQRNCVGGIEVRQSGETNTLYGYALKFDVTYDMGWFTESISRSALTEADMTDVRILFNHDPNFILGRTASKTATVGVDDIGLWYSVDLPKSPNGENVRVALERGDITQSSWGFYLDYTTDGIVVDDWQYPVNGKTHRTILKVKKVVDASPVTYPANPDTSAAKRSYEEQVKPTGPTPEEIQNICIKRLRIIELMEASNQ